MGVLWLPRVCSITATMAADPKAADYKGEGLAAEQPTDNEIDTNWDECIETFDAMDLREDLLRGIYGYGFEKPSAIQQVGSGAEQWVTGLLGGRGWGAAGTSSQCVQEGLLGCTCSRNNHAAYLATPWTAHVAMHLLLVLEGRHHAARRGWADDLT